MDKLMTCTKCKSKVPVETTKCKCGGTTFCYKGLVKFVDTYFKCGQCSSESLKHVYFERRGDKFKKEFECLNCGNVIGILSYKKQPRERYTK